MANRGPNIPNRRGIHVYLSNRELQRLSERAKQVGISESQFVRHLVRQFVHLPYIPEVTE